MEKPYESPPTSGCIELVVNIQPVSVQAVSEKKLEMKKVVLDAIREFDFYLSGDVAVFIEWYGNEQRRYEADDDPDTDNIIKPIIDALSGVDGILFDDCQLQHVSCSWIDTLEEDSLLVRVEFVPDEYCIREGIVFIQFDGGLCFPVNVVEKRDERLVFDLANNVNQKLQLRDKMRAENGYFAGKGIMPIQRLFHRTRLHGFQVIKFNEFGKIS